MKGETAQQQKGTIHVEKRRGNWAKGERVSGILWAKGSPKKPHVISNTYDGKARIVSH